MFSSWPSTRMRRCQACRSSSRSARLTLASTSRRWGRPPWRNSPPARLEAARAPGQGQVQDAAARPPGVGQAQLVGRLRPRSCSAGRSSSRSPGAVDEDAGGPRRRRRRRRRRSPPSPCAAGPWPRARPGAARAGCPRGRSPRAWPGTARRRPGCRGRGRRSPPRGRRPARLERVCRGRTTSPARRRRRRARRPRSARRASRSPWAVAARQEQAHAGEDPRAGPPRGRGGARGARGRPGRRRGHPLEQPYRAQR